MTGPHVSRFKARRTRSLSSTRANSQIRRSTGELPRDDTGSTSVRMSGLVRDVLCTLSRHPDVCDAPSECGGHTALRRGRRMTRRNRAGSGSDVEVRD